ncbi:hypothetical protein [Cohnella lupini]|uniref:Uncharacterized protein n=1 Tax=Cohnella lupini TaxID=1294267 RepID=A0A3D9I0U6_9BACL|nr:hypothetical protein [Cohnella lupini]RED54776.1 hypothetical protein DFP95_12132 [Cohnella lupini]
MALGDVSIWKLKPGLPGYEFGMDLGKPHEIVEAESFITHGRVHPTIVSPNSQKSAREKGQAKAKRFRLVKEEYLAARVSGLSRDMICERYNIKIGTLRTYLSEWDIQAPERETAAMYEYNQVLSM